VSYRFQNSVEVTVNRAAAWNYWTAVRNWEADPAVEEVILDGEFAQGSKGITRTKASGAPIEWEIRSVSPGEAAVIEIQLDGAVTRFDWKFEAVSENSARFTQTITVEGINADRYLPMVGEEFEEGVRQGMTKLAKEMERAAESTP